MTERGRWAAAVLGAIALLGLGAAACGDDSGSSATPQSTSNGAQASEPAGGGSDRSEREGSAPTGTPADGDDEGASAHQDSGGGAEQFVTPGGDNSVQEFGAEADETEFEDAAAALHAFLDARAEDDWATTCEYLSTDVLQSFETFAAGSEQLRGKGCPQLLASVSGPATEEARREAAIADVGALRVDGDRGFLLYRGADDIPYAIPMAREEGRWKVAALAGVPLS
jgi:hypothetical protein